MNTSERRLLIAIAVEGAHGAHIRKICNEIGNYKQNWYYLQKWCVRVWYEYGVSLDLGWLTAEGKTQAKCSSHIKIWSDS